MAAIVVVLCSGMAHARRGGERTALWTEICSVTAPAQAGQPDTPRKETQDAHVQHCAFCGKQDFSHALPSRAGELPQPLEIVAPAPADRVLSAAAPTQWLDPHPRGPPVVLR